ncbi:hypothetical protein WA1_08480 [Scytonema hofmannii PCC 7110]|uniref:Glycerophosphoryl diester phosphodiesterase membrane domain-containing protein n=1 Tax=Scytonema hofmannii PCC 7110 TaxID=128403 RepID=A0A139WRW6_9CYAN|nr:hypothetical protein [Scytonema hofmannii]KYC35184.1 hypothetical protein WA1_08480 [Scytonema hofmannii PCC 7110]
MQQLSIGNVVNLGFYLYRLHLKLYLKLAFTAHLWLLVPIYGWAKFYAIAGLISRLAFQNLIGHPETIQSAKIQVNRNFWKFLLTAILVTLSVFILFFIFYILSSLIAGSLFLIISFVIGSSPTLFSNNPFISFFFIIIIVPTIAAIYISPFWFYTYFFVTDIPLILDKINPFQTISKSWKLTRGHIRRILGIILISGLITFPILTLSWFVCSLFIGGVLGIFFQSFLDNPDNDSLLGVLVFFVLNTVTGILTMPFWQSVKAVVYYDIRCRKEGLDLKIMSCSVRKIGRLG